MSSRFTPPRHPTPQPISLETLAVIFACLLVCGLFLLMASGLVAAPSGCVEDSWRDPVTGRTAADLAQLGTGRVPVCR